MSELTFQEKGERLLVALYRLSRGIVGAEVRATDLEAECARVWKMSEDEYSNYCRENTQYRKVYN